MNRRRRRRVKRLMRAMPHESTVDRREHALLIEEEVQRAKLRGRRTSG